MPEQSSGRARRSPVLPRVGLRRIAAVTLSMVLTISGAALVAAPQSVASVPSLHSPSGLPRAIEPLVTYVGQNSCQPGYRPGTLALAHLLVRTYPNTSFGGAYSCGTDGSRSEHYDGRAVDWMNSLRNPTQAAQAHSVLAFLLATDRYGYKDSNARRMGIMYIIWNNMMWGAWDGKWEPYNNCAHTPSPALDSSCHRNHMHISMGWDGAMGRTSFWSKRVFATADYGPCRARDLNWAGDYAGFNPRGCPSYPGVGAPAHSSSAMLALNAYSGAEMHPGMAGNPVAAVQQAFRLPITARYDARTVAAVNRFKASRHLPANGVIDAGAWRALLQAYRPH